MNDETPSDAELLREYRGGSEAAFRDLVQRRLGLVHATARRVLAIAPHLADDVAQRVFSDLAKKAATLPEGVVLAGWLYRHSYFLALNAARAERRRRHAHERISMELNALHEDTTPEAAWAKLAPVLDDALNQLDPAERNAIVLRFLQCQDLRRVGRALGTSDDAAQKRVARALDKLRGVLTRGGTAISSTALLASTLEAHPAAALPTGLIGTISTQALTSAAADSSWSLSSIKTMLISKSGLVFVAALAGIGISAPVFSQNKSMAAEASTAVLAPVAAATPAAPVASIQAAASAAPEVSMTPEISAPPVGAAPAVKFTRNAGASVDEGTPVAEAHSSGISVREDKSGLATVTVTVDGETRTQTMPKSEVPADLIPTPFVPTGDPISSVTNADGSTTSVYSGPNGGSVTVTVSGDGQSRSTHFSSSGHE